MSETFRFRVLSTSPREHVLRLAVVHPDAALVRTEHTWVFLDALRALAGDRGLSAELDVELMEARNLVDPSDLFGDRGSPFPAALAALSDAETAAYFADEDRLPGADYRVRTSIDLELAPGATCDVA
jgi:hypothetical protein